MESLDKRKTLKEISKEKNKTLLEIAKLEAKASSGEGLSFADRLNFEKHLRDLRKDQTEADKQERADLLGDQALTLAGFNKQMQDLAPTGMNVEEDQRQYNLLTHTIHAQTLDRLAEFTDKYKRGVDPRKTISRAENQSLFDISSGMAGLVRGVRDETGVWLGGSALGEAIGLDFGIQENLDKGRGLKGLFQSIKSWDGANGLRVNVIPTGLDNSVTEGVDFYDMPAATRNLLTSARQESDPTLEKMDKTYI